MRLTSLDWAIIGLYLVFKLAIGLCYKARVGRNTREFFLSGRNAPWRLAGTSMVPTMFYADTPLALTVKPLRLAGIAGAVIHSNLSRRGWKPVAE